MMILILWYLYWILNMFISNSFIKQKICCIGHNFIWVHRWNIPIIEFIPFVFMRTICCIMPSIQTTMVIHYSIQPIFSRLCLIIALPILRFNKRFLIIYEVIFRASRTYHMIRQVQLNWEFYFRIIFAFLVSNLFKATKLED